MIGACTPHWCSDDLVAYDFGLFVEPERRGGLAAAGLLRGFIRWARDTEARLQLRESLRLREAMPGDHQGLLGDHLRLLGATSIGLGDPDTAERQLRHSVTLTRQGSVDRQIGRVE